MPISTEKESFQGSHKSVTQVSLQFIGQRVPEHHASNREGPKAECTQARSQNQ